MDVRVGLWRRLSAEELMLLNRGVGEDSWESLELQEDPTNPFWRRSALGFLWKEWCWSWNSSTSATSCEELTHWKRLWCWEGLEAGGEGADRGWDGWMASLTWWTWVWVNSGSWWWTGRPGVLQFMGSQRVGHDWVTELNWLIFSLRTPDCFLLLWDPGLLINLHRNWLSQYQEVTSANKFYLTKLNISIPFYTKRNTENCSFLFLFYNPTKPNIKMIIYW